MVFNSESLQYYSRSEGALSKSSQTNQDQDPGEQEKPHYQSLDMGHFTYSNDIWNSMEEQQLDDRKNYEEARLDGFEWINMEDAIYAHSLHSSLDSYSEAHLFYQTVKLSRFLFEYLGRIQETVYLDHRLSQSKSQFLSSALQTSSSTRPFNQSVNDRLSDSSSTIVSESPCPVQLVLPAELSYQLAKDIVRLANDEPCGVAGCEMVVAIDRTDNSGDSNKKEESSDNRTQVLIDTVCLDMYTTPTFQIRIELCEDSRRCLFNLHNIGVRLGLVKSGPRRLFVHPTFRLVKKQFYRSMSSSFTS